MAAWKKCQRMGSAEKRGHGAWVAWFILRETVREGKGKEGWKDRGMEEWGHVCGHLSAYSCVSGLLFNILASNKLFWHSRCQILVNLLWGAECGLVVMFHVYCAPQSQQTTKLVQAPNSPWVSLREMGKPQFLPVLPGTFASADTGAWGFRFCCARQEEVFPIFCASISSSHMFLSKISPLYYRGLLGIGNKWLQGWVWQRRLRMPWAPPPIPMGSDGSVV